MILQALCNYYQRASQDPEQAIIPLGYAMLGASAELVISPEGDLIAINSLLVPLNKKTVPKQLIVPLPPKRAGAKPEPAFLYENVSFIFGVEDEENKALYRFDASRKKHRSILKNCDDVGAQALLKFFDKRPLCSTEWPGVDTSMIQGKAKKGLFLVFRLDGDTCFLHERPAIRDAWEKYRLKKEAELPQIQCLITGEMAPLAVLHGNVGGFGVDKPSLVSFNSPAFCSYGLKQGENAPVGQKAAFEYVTALNMLCRDKRHHFNLGQDKIVFWAEDEYPDLEEGISSLMTGMYDETEEDDAEDSAPVSASQRIRNVLTSILSGKGLDYEAEYLNTKFYLLGICPNRTRLVVRFFHESTFGDFLARLATHYALLSIEGMKDPYPSPYQLLISGALNYDKKNIPPSVESALLRSILHGSPYPSYLFQSVLNRIKAERKVTPLRAAILKASINRMENKEVLKVSLDRNEQDISYMLGRLLSLFEKTQYLALGETNSSIVDKYLNAAMTTPQKVFPTLLNLNNKHMSKLQRYGKNRSRIALSKEIGEIMEKLTLKSSTNGAFVFPNYLNQNEQGKFMVGFYHQNQENFKKKQNPNDSVNDEDNNEIEE